MSDLERIRVVVDALRDEIDRLMTEPKPKPKVYRVLIAKSQIDGMGEWALLDALRYDSMTPVGSSDDFWCFDASQPPNKERLKTFGLTVFELQPRDHEEWMHFREKDSDV